MTFYSDKRSRYADAAPWDFTAGTGRPDNRTKTEAKTISAARVPDTYEQNEKGEFKLVAGNKTPRDNFRVTTAPTKPESPVVPPQLPQNPTVLAPIPISGTAPSKDFNSVLAKDASTVV